MFYSHNLLPLKSQIEIIKKFNYLEKLQKSEQIKCSIINILQTLLNLSHHFYHLIDILVKKQ